MRLLIVGPNSIHLSNFIQLIEGFIDDFLFLTDSPPKDQAQNFRLVNFSIKNPFKIRKSIKEMNRIIREYKPDLIHVHEAGTHAFLVLQAVGARIPVIVTAWGSDILLVPKCGWLSKKMVQFILRRAKGITSDSIHMAEVMKSLVPDLKPNITIVNYGIDEISPKQNKEKLFYSNRLHDQLYRIDKILESFKSFLEASRDSGYKLVIAGEGKETENLKKLAAELGISESVEFTGWLDKKSNQEYYSRAMCFISIPGSDATSISLLEAMSAGCIPIVSDLPANREWIINGENGIIVNDLNENFLEKAINLNADNVKRINRDLFLEKASKNINRDKFLQLYKQILMEK